MKFKTLLFLAMSAATTVCNAQSLGAGIKVENAGLDGDERIYNAACPDAKRYVLSRHFKEGKICYVNAKDKEVCVVSEDTDAVATQACNGQ